MCKYRNFVQMYDDYLTKFDNIIRILSEWKSAEFYSFMNDQLENEMVKKYIGSPMLCMLPWYLYTPFDQLKLYYKFFRDLKKLSNENDDDKKSIDDCLEKFTKVYHNIKQNEKRLKAKIKLLEVQLQIQGNFKTFVKDERYFIMNKPCQMRRKASDKKHRKITAYLFSDLFVWTSRGKYKGSYSFFNEELQIEKSKKNWRWRIFHWISIGKIKKSVCLGE